MDPSECQAFHFEFASTDSETAPRPARTGLHVRWASLPKPDHETGNIIYTSHVELDSTDPNRSAYRSNARRRSTNLDSIGQQIRPFGSSHGKRRHSLNSTPKFREVRWADEPHPGKRIPVDVYEGESISPRSSAVVVPLWCTAMEAKMFRTRVQPKRVTGKRRPGMTTGPETPARAVRRSLSSRYDG